MLKSAQVASYYTKYNKKNKAIVDYTSPVLCTPITPFHPIGDAAYHQHARGGPSHGHRQHAQKNWQRSSMWFRRCKTDILITYFATAPVGEAIIRKTKTKNRLAQVWSESQHVTVGLRETSASLLVVTIYTMPNNRSDYFLMILFRTNNIMSAIF